MYKVFIIHPDGTETVVEQKKAPEYNQLRDAVKGFIETVPYFTKYNGLARGTAFCNEEGKLHGLPFNEKATKAWYESCPKGDKSRMNLNGSVIFYAKVKAGA